MTRAPLLLSFCIGDARLQISETNGHVEDPVWIDIESKLQLLLSKRLGTVTLHLLQQDDGPQSLQVRAEAGQFIVTLGELIGDEYSVRSYWNEREPAGERVLHIGDYWDARMICRDPAFVLDVFSDFYETGTVAHSKLSV